MAQSKVVLRQSEQPEFCAALPDDDVSDTGFVDELVDRSLDPMSGMEDF